LLLALERRLGGLDGRLQTGLLGSGGANRLLQFVEGRLGPFDRRVLLFDLGRRCEDRLTEPGHRGCGGFILALCRGQPGLQLAELGSLLAEGDLCRGEVILEPLARSVGRSHLCRQLLEFRGGLGDLLTLPGDLLGEGNLRPGEFFGGCILRRQFGLQRRVGELRLLQRRALLFEGGLKLDGFFPGGGRLLRGGVLLRPILAELGLCALGVLLQGEHGLVGPLQVLAELVDPGLAAQCLGQRAEGRP